MVYKIITVVFFVLTAFWIIARANRKDKKAEKKLHQAVEGKKTEAYALYPKIDLTKCSGCTACTQVCPEGDILQMIRGKAVLVTPTKCVGHSLCQRACPVDAITMVFGTKEQGKKVPNYDENYETNVPGLYIAGELGGMGLISNAIKQGVLATEHAISNLKKTQAQLDVLIIGAGPAGIASSLKCHEKKVNYQCVDQNSFGGTVYNFPRQKLVMSHPAALPLVGKMSFPKNRISKEGLLEYWNSVRKKFKLKIKEKVKFIDLKPRDGFFEVETSEGTVTSQKVILAVGVGGTPRKLGLPNEDIAKVAYSLSDPNQYKGQHMVIVGAGDSAVEAAQRVASPKLKNKVYLIVRKDSLSRCKEDNKIKVEKMAKDGLLEIWFNSGVAAIEEKTLTMKKGEETIKLQNDFLILFMGTIPPFGFLEKLGITIRTLYGQPLSSKPQAESYLPTIDSKTG